MRTPSQTRLCRARFRITGIVQGVGFRPFVHGLANALALTGWVLNDSEGVLVEVQGAPVDVGEFCRRLTEDAPPMARVTSVTRDDLDPIDEVDFSIRPSRTLDARRTLISPDAATCKDCLRELFDPADRRFRYPFINCTHCGPRFTIVTDIPYDRPNTTMKPFIMCPDCLREYEDPSNRRFHAQPNACPVCGPHVTLLDNRGRIIDVADPVAETANLLRKGRVVAVKGLGGLHLAVMATDPDAVARLRERKHREEKPLAVMVANIESASRQAQFSPEAIRILQSPERPIVLVPKRSSIPLAEGIAPKSRYVGLMLPYTPLHHLLMAFGFDGLVMTSGNQTDEPIAIDNDEAVARLGHIADAFLVHNRDIHLRSDDSVVRADPSGLKQRRRSRGYVPIPLPIIPGPEVLALGPELKNTLCITRGDQAFVSQHVGDLENLETWQFFQQTLKHLLTILDVEPQLLAHDMHPQYMTTRYANEQDRLPTIAVQHHHAHAASAMVEHGLTGEVLAIIWDGAGYGPDGTIWGSEFLRVDLASFRRLGHMRAMKLPGGDRAVYEPWRSAFAALHEAFPGALAKHIPPALLTHQADFEILETMLNRNLNCPVSCGAGRLFDIVSALAGVCTRRTYEGQPAIELEAVLRNGETGAYELPLDRDDEGWILDWRPMLREVVGDVLSGVETPLVSARFHNGFVRTIVDLSRKLREETRLERVVLSGGVFQNQYLGQQVLDRLSADGFQVFEQKLIPANAGGVSLGQAAVARALSTRKG